jgi:hypothetical protein
VQADAGKSGGKKIATPQAPQNRTGKPRQNAGCEDARDGGMLTGGTGFHHFVQMTQTQAAAWQMLIDGLDAEGERRGRAAAMRCHLLQTSAKFGNSYRLAGEGHPRGLPEVQTFYICSLCARSQWDVQNARKTGVFGPSLEP